MTGDDRALGGRRLRRQLIAERLGHVAAADERPVAEGAAVGGGRAVDELVLLVDRRHLAVVDGRADRSEHRLLADLLHVGEHR